MTAKEYLEQARYLDMRINSKLEQVASLNNLATKCTAILTGMPHGSNKNTSQMSDTIDKIIDLESEINNDIDYLVDLKKEISETISKVDDTEYRTILEKRYLCFESWEKISKEMLREKRWIQKLHNRALEKVDVILKKYKIDHEKTLKDA